MSLSNKEGIENENLKPHISPAKAPKSKTRRLSKYPLYIIGGLGIIITLILVVVGAGKGVAVVEEEDQLTDRSTNHLRQAEDLLRDISNPKPLPVIEEEIEEEPELFIPIGTEDDEKEPPKTYSSEDLDLILSQGSNQGMGSLRVEEVDQDLVAIQQMKSDAFMKALASSTIVDTGGGGLGSDRLTRTALTSGGTGSDYVNQRMAQLNADGSLGGSGGMGGMMGGLFGGAESGAPRSEMSLSSSQWKLNSEVEQGSKFQMRTGTIIPAMLLTEINSDLPGIIQGQVSQNVYDTETGQYLLIPQGTRLIGEYNSDITYGQSRVMIAWNRLIFPNGSSLDIGDMPGADSMGKSGLNDKVNNHYGKMFLNALLMSGITGVVSYTQDRNNDNNNDNNNRRTMSDSMSQALGQQFGQVTMEMIRKNMNVSPTLEISAGFRFNVIVTKDIDFTGSYK